MSVLARESAVETSQPSLTNSREEILSETPWSLKSVRPGEGKLMLANGNQTEEERMAAEDAGDEP